MNSLKKFAIHRKFRGKTFSEADVKAALEFAMNNELNIFEMNIGLISSAKYNSIAKQKFVTFSESFKEQYKKSEKILIVPNNYLKGRLTTETINFLQKKGFLKMLSQQVSHFLIRKEIPNEVTKKMLLNTEITTEEIITFSTDHTISGQLVESKLDRLVKAVFKNKKPTTNIEKDTKISNYSID